MVTYTFKKKKKQPNLIIFMDLTIIVTFEIVTPNDNYEFRNVTPFFCF